MASPRRSTWTLFYFTVLLSCCITACHGGDREEKRRGEVEADVLYGYPMSAETVLKRKFQTAFGSSSEQKSSKKSQHWTNLLNLRYSRELEDAAYGDDDAYVNNANGDDDDAAAAAAGDDYYAAADDDDLAVKDYGDDYYDDFVRGDNEMCAGFLVSFLEGTTDARDTCEGIMNAYTAAECTSKDFSGDHNYDDYFEEFTEHQCCQALQNHHSDYCEEDNLLSNLHLLLAVTVLLLCECAKAAVEHFHVHFLPEAAVCILVGTTVGLASSFMAGNIDDLSFDDELFLSLLLPPIVFEAALSVSKVEFKRRRGAIFMFSVFGTLISTFSTGLMVHYGSKMIDHALTFPMLDSLVFGALISSIDPVAILSVLTSLNLNQKDTIFILVFGESLLNDGIAITVFQTLVDRFDGKTNDGSISLDEILDVIATFLIAMFGSIAVGLACGCGAFVFFSVLSDYLPPVMEVGGFFLWALVPYYICDAIGWSGIVSIVAVAFFMDVYIAGPKNSTTQVLEDVNPIEPGVPRPRRMSSKQMLECAPTDYRGMVDDSTNHNIRFIDDDASSFGSLPTSFSMSPLPSTERIHLSSTADKHVRFVAHLTSRLAENAIFAYLGLFLFSNNYDWNPTLVTIAIVSCVLSRTFMVLIVSFMIFNIYKCRGVNSTGGRNSSRTAAAIQDRRTQAVLVLAGLRGAVSLALVENVPIYNNVSGEGCEFKQLMKGMTSAAILFTTFVFGGGAYYVLPHLGITQDNHRGASPTPGANHPKSSVVSSLPSTSQRLPRNPSPEFVVGNSTLSSAGELS